MMPKTYDILYIVMPDEDVINTRFMNYFDQDCGNRCEIGFSAAYETVANLALTKLKKQLPNTKRF